MKWIPPQSSTVVRNETKRGQAAWVFPRCVTNAMDYIDFDMSVTVRFDSVMKEFDGVRVLHGVSFELAPGRIYGLIGENGAGKSTLMKILSGYESITGGRVHVDGQERHFDGSR